MRHARYEPFFTCGGTSIIWWVVFGVRRLVFFLYTLGVVPILWVPCCCCRLFLGPPPAQQRTGFVTFTRQAKSTRARVLLCLCTHYFRHFAVFVFAWRNKNLNASLVLLDVLAMIRYGPLAQPLLTHTLAPATIKRRPRRSCLGDFSTGCSCTTPSFFREPIAPSSAGEASRRCR